MHDYGGQDAPGSNVVGGGASDDNCAEPGFMDASFLYDTRQYRKGGNAHGDSHEKAKRKNSIDSGANR
jgi:hypothetical protein